MMLGRRVIYFQVLGMNDNYFIEYGEQLHSLEFWEHTQTAFGLVACS